MKPSRDSSRSMAVTVESIRGSVAGRNPTRGIMRTLASSSERSVRLHEGAPLAVETVGAHVCVDLVTQGAPPLGIAVESRPLDGLDSPISRYPSHHLHSR
jgi:hypothetical protein